MILSSLVILTIIFFVYSILDIIRNYKKIKSTINLSLIEKDVEELKNEIKKISGK